MEEVEDRHFFYIPSFSSRTIVYKGLLLAPQIANFYGELADPRVKSAICVVHQRFSTNTFPSWPLAHPYRYIAHNGEINTLRGNVNWMKARESLLKSPLFGEDMEKLFPDRDRRAAATRRPLTAPSSCSSNPAARCRM